MKITECPTCGSARIRRVRKTLRREYAGQSYTVPNLTFWQCPDCDERLFDRTPMRQIEACSPAYIKPKHRAVG